MYDKQLFAKGVAMSLLILQTLYHKISTMSSCFNINKKRFSTNGRKANLIINYSSAKRLHSSLFIQNPLEINE